MVLNSSPNRRHSKMKMIQSIMAQLREEGFQVPRLLREIQFEIVVS